MQAGRQRSSGWRRHAGDVLKNTGPGMVVSLLSPRAAIQAAAQPGAYCPWRSLAFMNGVHPSVRSLFLLSTRFFRKYRGKCATTTSSSVDRL